MSARFTPKGDRCVVKGLSKEYAAFERDIVRGALPCPFTVEFYDVDSKLVGNWPVKLDEHGNRKSEFKIMKPRLVKRQ